MLFHLAVAADWHAAASSGEPYAWSMPGVPLADVGFVHCSYDHQVESTRQRYYADRDDLVLLTIDPGRLTSPVREEDGFPHVYGPVDPGAVVATSPARPA